MIVFSHWFSLSPTHFWGVRQSSKQYANHFCLFPLLLLQVSEKVAAGILSVRFSASVRECFQWCIWACLPVCSRVHETRSLYLSSSLSLLFSNFSGFSHPRRACKLVSGDANRFASLGFNRIKMNTICGSGQFPFASVKCSFGWIESSMHTNSMKWSMKLWISSHSARFVWGPFTQFPELMDFGERRALYNLPRHSLYSVGR